MDSRPLGRNKGDTVDFVANLENFLGKHTLSTHHTMIELGDVDCY